MSLYQEASSIAHFPNTAFDVVVIAASLGGITAISELLSALPMDFPSAILIVQHLSPKHPSMLAQLLNKHSALPVQWAEQSTLLQPGTVYLAPPDYHVFVTRSGYLRLSQSPPIHFVRLSADPLFESVARYYGKRAIAVVLTGSGRDGLKGVEAIKLHGGRVLIQDQATSQAFNMPRAALETGCVDFVLPLPMIARALIALVMVRGAATICRLCRASTNRCLY